MGNVPTITVNMDEKCKECGKGGATPSGLCLVCVVKAMKGKLMKTPTGRGFAAKWEAAQKRAVKEAKRQHPKAALTAISLFAGGKP